MAFVKILKKFDKVSNRQSSATYLKAVKRSHFISSDKVVKLMDEVELSFTKQFAKDDRKKAMKFLRPRQHKESHMVTFFVGLFTGSFVTLFAVYAILAHISGMFSPGTEAGYVETVYPVFRCNLFLWKATRINYNFIFEFQANTTLKYRDAFLVCTCMMTAVVSAMVLHLILASNGFSPSQVDTIPGILLLIFIGLLVCPLNIFYRSTRYCFLRVIHNIIFSPLYKFSGSHVKDEISGMIQSNETESGEGEGKASTSNVFQALQFLLKLCSRPLLVLGEKIQDSLPRVLPDIFATSSDVSAELHKLHHSPKLVALQEILEERGIGVDGSTSEGSVSVGQHRYTVYKIYQSTAYGSDLKGCVSVALAYMSWEDNGYSQRLGSRLTGPQNGQRFSLPRARNF